MLTRSSRRSALHSNDARAEALFSPAVRGRSIRRPAVFVLLLCLIGVPTAQAGSIAVVVNPSVEVDDVSFTEFRKIMLGDRQFWRAGSRITLIVRRPVAIERTVLLEQVYKMSEPQYRQYWVAKVFRAEATSGPRVVLSNDQALELVGVIEGAIGVVDANDVPEGVKILKVDGLLPGDTGYVFNH